MVRSEREYRSMMLDASDDFTVEGYASTFDEPYHLYTDKNIEVWEVVDSRAFDDCDMTDVIMQYDHEGRVFARTRNHTLDVEPDSSGLHIRAMLGGTQLGRGLYEDIKGGYIDRMSFAFTVKSEDWAEEKRDDGTRKLTRTILSIPKLYDVSAVSFPANDQATISARALCDGVIAQVEAERLRVERERQIKMLELKIKIMKGLQR